MLMFYLKQCILLMCFLKHVLVDKQLNPRPGLCLQGGKADLGTAPLPTTLEVQPRILRMTSPHGNQEPKGWGRPQKTDVMVT